jgi:hypothetical protein
MALKIIHEPEHTMPLTKPRHACFNLELKQAGLLQSRGQVNELQYNRAIIQVVSCT